MLEQVAQPDLGYGSTTLAASCKECGKGEGESREAVKDVTAGEQWRRELTGFVVNFDRRSYRIAHWVGCQM